VKTFVVEGGALSSDVVRAWRRIIDENRGLSSPYFRPQFTQAVAKVRDDVRVLVVENRGSIVALFPFQRGRFGRGRPVGGPLSDYHGLIAGRDFDHDLTDLLRAAHLNSWTFDHLPLSQLGFERFVIARSESPIIDLSNGFESYRSQRTHASSKHISRLESQARRLERDHGPIRFLFDTRDERVLQTLIQWKADQCERTRVPNVFGVSWTVALVNQLLATRAGDHFSGILSAMYAGNRLVAAHMGMRARSVLHYWFPSYDRSFQQYSPGLLLLLNMARKAASGKVSTIDLGKGDALYK
jgi:CelD/BcsL family acetyltransferase involved in cellulose biosynthesis